MSSAFIPTRTRISTDRYQMMVATGVLTKYDRIELIEGDMLDMAPMGTKHSAITSKIHELFVLMLLRSATVVSGGPVNLGEFSQPQPDLMLLKRRADFYSGKTPEAADVLLLIEVSDSSLAFDQGVKLNLYARYGVAEYWVVDPELETIKIYRRVNEAFVRAAELSAEQKEALTTPLLPEFSALLADIFAAPL